VLPRHKPAPFLWWSYWSSDYLPISYKHIFITNKYSTFKIHISIYEWFLYFKLFFLASLLTFKHTCLGIIIRFFFWFYFIYLFIFGAGNWTQSFVHAR
jgi:hypothetical protein